MAGPPPSLFGGGDMPGTVSITLTSGRLSLTQQDLRGLTWDQHTHIWRVRSCWLACSHAGRCRPACGAYRGMSRPKCKAFVRWAGLQCYAQCSFLPLLASCLAAAFM